MQIKATGARTNAGLVRRGNNECDEEHGEDLETPTVTKDPWVFCCVDICRFYTVTHAFSPTSPALLPHCDHDQPLGLEWLVYEVSLPRIIPPHIRDDLKFIKFEMSGEYYVHPKFLTEAEA